MALSVLALLLAAQAPDAAKPPAPKICRQSMQETGSHIRSGKRCKTAEEWAREDEEKTRLAPSARITEGQGDALTKSPPH